MNTQHQTADKSETTQDQLWVGMSPERYASYQEDIHSGLFRPGTWRVVFLGTLSGLLAALIIFLASESYHAFAQPPPRDEAKSEMPMTCTPTQDHGLQPSPNIAPQHPQTEGFFDGIYDI